MNSIRLFFTLEPTRLNPILESRSSNHWRCPMLQMDQATQMLVPCVYLLMGIQFFKIKLILQKKLPNPKRVYNALLALKYNREAIISSSLLLWHWLFAGSSLKDQNETLHIFCPFQFPSIFLASMETIRRNKAQRSPWRSILYNKDKTNTKTTTIEGQCHGEVQGKGPIKESNKSILSN